ncbi:MAG TPA: galactitol-1-phosphate 5-dehydrogenase [Opitutaceae bacterium]
MNALLLSAPSCLEFTSWPDPEPAEDEVIVRIRACGICGSDLHGWDGSSGRRRPPLIMGHEASGEIHRVGSQVDASWQPGDRVTFDSTLFCGKCPSCRRGEVNLCEHRRVVGVAPPEYRQHGAFADFVAVPARTLYRLPDGLAYAEAAMVEPVAIALHAVGRVALEPGFTSVVVGSGMIGLLVIQALRCAGAGRIIAVDLDETRLKLARELGATDTVRSAGEGTLDQLRALVGGRGADVAFEVVGLTPTVDLAVQSVRPGGSVVLVGNVRPRVEFSLQAVVTREITVFGSCSSAGEYPRALELIADGRIQVRPLITATVPLKDGAAWFSRLTSPEGRGLLKVILEP